MKRYNKDSIDNLSDVFCAWMGGYPETDAEINQFLQTSKLNQLMSVADMDVVIYHNGYFANETLLSVYSLIPIKLKTKNIEPAILPEMLNRYNKRVSQGQQSKLVNISFAKALDVYDANYPEKYNSIKKVKAYLRSYNYRIANPDAAKKAYKNRMAGMTEEEKIIWREKNRLNAQIVRAKNPEPYRESASKYWHNLPEEKKAFLRIDSRERNKKYREENAEAIRARNNERRRLLKEENAELLKEQDRIHNQNANRQESCKKYYEKNKEIVAQKAKDNPKVKEYKRRYKLKQRFQKNTGEKILALLQGIANSKSQ